MSKICLVLGGGGARGFAHIGLLKELERHQIKIDSIVGVSIGAIVGGLYSYFRDADQVERHLKNFLFSDEFKANHIYDLKEEYDQITDSFWDQVVKVVKERIIINVAASKLAMTDGTDLEDGINHLFSEIQDFSQLNIPFHCLATDLITGNPKIYSDGNLKEAIRASANVPGYFPPITNGDEILVDGAVANNLPANVARELYPGYKVIISDVSESINKKLTMKSVYDVVIRCAGITQYQYANFLKSFADVVIENDVGDVVWYDFAKFDELVEKGRQAAKLKINEIKRVAGKESSFFHMIKKIFNVN
ncbi:MAG: hypothetical protein Kow00108_15350 [Calditrichia bacterium]